MVNNNFYTQYDDTLYFTFNGIHSKLYNTFINRENRDDFVVISEIANNIDFTTPMYANSSYVNSANISQYTISMHIVCYNITAADYDYIRHWLHIGQQGLLMFDSNLFWGYQAIITNCSEAAYMYINNNQILAEFDLEFKTTGIAGQVAVTNPQWSSDMLNNINVRTQDDQMIANEFCIPELHYDRGMRIPHVCSGGYYFSTSFSTKYYDNYWQYYKAIRIIKNDDREHPLITYYLQSQNELLLQYDSKTGLLTHEGHILDLANNLLDNQRTQNFNTGIVFNITQAPETVNSKHDDVKKSMDITLTDKEYYKRIIHKPSNIFYAMGHIVDLSPQYGIDTYGNSVTEHNNEFYNFRYSGQGGVWIQSDDKLSVMPQADGLYHISVQNTSSINSALYNNNAANMVYTIGNFDTIKIQGLDRYGDWYNILPDSFTIEKYKQ